MSRSHRPRTRDHDRARPQARAQARAHGRSRAARHLVALLATLLVLVGLSAVPATSAGEGPGQRATTERSATSTQARRPATRPATRPAAQVRKLKKRCAASKRSAKKAAQRSGKRSAEAKRAAKRARTCARRLARAKKAAKKAAKKDTVKPGGQPPREPGTDEPGTDQPGTDEPGTDQSWEPRPAEYPATVTRTDLPITMDDGVVLRGDLVLPATAEETPVDVPVPVIVTITAYNKSAIGGGLGATLGLADPNYLVERGYAQLTVDARGTGSSEGRWAAFSERENTDAGAVVEWAAAQPWSTGEVGMTGASYMGISQLFAAGQQPEGLKAIFPQVPAADVYRDVVASGGQIDVGFIPLWLGLVTVTGILPPAVAAQDPESGFGALFDHLVGAGEFTLPLMLQALLGGDPAYDGPFYRERSPIEVLEDVTVPTFLVGGEFDLFQRGTPLVFEELQERGVPTKLVFGPWDHLQGSGDAVGEAGYGSLAELHLRWFDHWIMGLDTQLDEIAPLTYYEQGSGDWVRADEWIDDDLSARTFELSGTATTGGGHAALTTGEAVEGRSTILPLPVTGLCTRSASQWTAGIPAMILPDLPCLQDNALNDAAGLVFETEPLTETLRFQGPLNARLRVSTPTGDGMLSVAVEDVAPDGTVSRISGGWQVISQRELDEGRSRYLDGELIQPYHPFTRESKQLLGSGEVAPVDVEIFPTGAAIRPGHRLRLAVQMFDIPHLLSPLPDLLTQTVPLTLHTSPQEPSTLTLPVR